MADVIGTGKGKKPMAWPMRSTECCKIYVLKCARDEGVRDYLHVAVIGYGAQVGPAFSGALAGRQLIPMIGEDIGNSPARVEQRNKKVPDGAGGLVDQPIRFPVSFDAVANGGTR